MKSTSSIAALAVLMAAAAILPAVAQDAEPRERPNAAAHMEKHKQKMDARYKEGQQRKAEHRAKIDALHEQCHKRMQGADTPEQMRAVKEDCMAKGKEMKDKAQAKREENREERQDKRAEKREDWKEKRGEMKDKRAEMKAKHEERKANRATAE